MAETTTSRRRIQWQNLLPYLIVVMMAAVSVYALTVVSHRADYKLCQELNRNRSAILALVNSQGQPIQAPPGSPAFVQEILDASAARGAAFRERAAQELAPEDCSRI